MGDMLSQDEINALLGGLAASDSDSKENTDTENTEQNTENTEQNTENTENTQQNTENTITNMENTENTGGLAESTTQDTKSSNTESSQKNAENNTSNLQNNISKPENTTQNTEDATPNSETTVPTTENQIENLDNLLTIEQKDILGEIGNISMGTSATTLYALLGHKVTIDTPNVRVKTWGQLEKSYDRPCVGIRVGYKEGLVGSNILILRQFDVKIISNLMMGGDGNVIEEGELNEIDLSAIGEAMNQMVGSSSTSLSSMIKMKIDIDTPHAFVLDFKENKFFETTGFDPDETLVCISFKMQIGNLIDSEIMQILPKDFAIKMVETLKKDLFTSQEQDNAKITPKKEDNSPQNNQQKPPTQNQQKPVSESQKQHITKTTTQTSQQNINVSPATFQNFEISSEMQKKENIDIIMDVPLEVTVELGRTYKKIRDILEFSPGTIVELNKLAGEPIDILVNGKFIAKGEVVVIDENFGIRITDIMSVENRV